MTTTTDFYSLPKLALAGEGLKMMILATSSVSSMGRKVCWDYGGLLMGLGGGKTMAAFWIILCPRWTPGWISREWILLV